MDLKLSREGFVLSILLPANWIVLFYAYIAHVWITLGRWPVFGENIPGPLIKSHGLVVIFHYVGLVYLLAAAVLLFLLGLAQQRFRPLILYSLCYGAAVGLASCALFFLSPGPFRNWLFD